MKKRIPIITAIILIVSMVLSVSTLAVPSGTQVRVNGKLVVFPDGQPFINSDNRTMIPVRFVTEEMGADVSWDGPNRIAIVEKDDIRIEIPIGSRNLRVIKDGVESTVIMDTVAVVQDSRTYVPIRFVAEALGAYVDYANAYKTVGIYSDILSAEEIETLRNYDYTQPKVALGYEDAKARYNEEELKYRYGDKRETFVVYENAHEFLYEESVRYGDYAFRDIDLILKNASATEFYEAVARQAAAELAYKSERLTIEFRTDVSCIYQPDNMNYMEASVRGYAVAKLNCKPTALKGDETLKLYNLGFTKLVEGVELTSAVDVHMNTLSGYRVNVNTIVPLANNK